MMRRWFTGREESAQEVMAVPEQVDAQPVDPHAFIAEQEPSLVASADAWRSIAQKSKEREEGYIQHIRQGLIDVWNANSNGAPLPDDRILDRDTEKLATDLSVYCLMAARYFSTSATEWGIHKRIQSHFLEIPNHTVNYIIRKEGFPTRRFMMRQLWLAQEMEKADIIAGEVLGGLTHTYQNHPDDLEELAGLYENGADEADGRFAELKVIVAADWHRPNPEESTLRQFCEQLRTNPGVYVPEFVGMVSDGERGQRWSSVRGMARFAIIAAGGNPDDSAEIQNMLKSTYGRWGEVQDIDSLFQSFVQYKVDATVNNFNTIAGSKAARNIRAYPSAEQVESFKDYFGVQYTPDRTSRRKAERAAVKTHRADLLPTAQSIDSVAASESLTDKQPRNLIAAVKTDRGWNLQDSSVGQLLDRFKIGQEGELASDIDRMISWLQVNPISPASERLTKHGGVRIAAQGNPVRLWRFAPNRAPEVPVHPDNRYWRIVYGVAKNSLIVADIINHDDFDKKYK